MSLTSMPAEVQDGYSKSKFAGDWKVGSGLKRDLPGNIVQAIRRAGSRSCVMMLDEIDKLGAGGFR